MSDIPRASSLPHEKHVLVAGAGVAGPLVCYWLKKAGYLPTLIEKSPFLRQGGHAVDIRGIAVQVAKKMGIYEEICRQRTQIATTRYVDSEGKTLMEQSGEAAGFRHGEEVEIVRGDLIAIIMSTIEDVPRYFQQSITAIRNHDDCVEVDFNDGKKGRFGLLIGCDGLHSSVRKRVFTENEVQLNNLGFYISVFNHPNYLQLRQSEIIFKRYHKLVHVSSDKDADRARTGFLFRSKKTLTDKRNMAAQKQFLREHFQHAGWETDTLLEYMDKATELYFDSISQIKMPYWTKGRVALVGDAGYCASPLSGQGTSLALVGAYILAGELKAAAGNHAIAFERYNSLMRPFVEANQDFGAFISQTYLVDDAETDSKQVDENRMIMEKLQAASGAMCLPEYEDMCRALTS
ncbi:FAD-binding protein [Legionella geestiana]|uniref:FAD-dependent monooxygenase n=1 Tax=Legionella geestiana TaxID=45065 RepID=UPI001092AA23|nr:FAD-dependent monooxygenase [Legionella geestiana]QDQ39238.1 FAD-binding protein [Legionella geestiana]